ncbi:MAG TPA: hypothetical protein VJ761_21870 [Ktedonobacteraceae bacterium]|nr:hypothetical protein [Ktedonobacteraceae bacterium]
MSHIVEARTKIQHPDLALLRQAAEIVASAHEGGHVEDHILDYGRRGQSVSSGLALFTRRVFRGIGIEIDEAGMLSFKGDPWAVHDEFTRLQQELVQTYVSLATMAALQQMGYSAEASQEEQQVIIRGVAYA